MYPGNFSRRNHIGKKLKRNRTAIVSLGGIRRISDIPLFLFNMFNDKHILPAVQPFRAFLSILIMVMRAGGTYTIYKRVKSPVFDIVEKQVGELKNRLNGEVAALFNYSKPFLKKKDGGLCVPLYGFYSHTTHGGVFEKCAKVFPPLCLFGEFFDMFEDRIKKALLGVPDVYKDNVVVLLSAHSLPVKLAKKTNDPYRNDIEVFSAYLKKRIDKPIYLSFQSKLGPIEWFEPSTESMIKKLSLKYKALIIVPISFVCDNTETVYEIDITYKNLAEQTGIEYFYKVECFNDSGDFMEFLSEYLNRSLK